MNTWSTARSFEHAYIRNIEDETGEIVAQVLDLDDYPNDIKRARLIAAAPDLLAALKSMLREHDALQLAERRTGDRWPAATLARAAIAKATGES